MPMRGSLSSVRIRSARSRRICSLTRSAVETILAGLKKAGGFLRLQLGKRIKIHQIPELHFKFDESLERGISLSALIDEANATRAKED